MSRETEDSEVSYASESQTVGKIARVVFYFHVKQLPASSQRIPHLQLSEGRQTSTESPTYLKGVSRRHFPALHFGRILKISWLQCYPSRTLLVPFYPLLLFILKKSFLHTIPTYKKLTSTKYIFLEFINSFSLPFNIIIQFINQINILQNHAFIKYVVFNYLPLLQ